MALPFKTGRGPAVRPAGLSDLAVYAQGKLERPPAKIVSPKIELPIDGNATYGDCTIAGLDHVVRIARALYGATGVLPSESKLVQKYLQLSPNDEGLVEAYLLNIWQTKGLGLFGGQPHGYAPVPPKDILQIQQSIAFYGTCYFGITCGAPQQEAFVKGEPWEWVEGQEEDGHCVVGMGYDSGGVECATWGGKAYLTYGYLAHALVEAWCIFTHQLVEAKKDTLGVDIVTLEADLRNV